MNLKNISVNKLFIDKVAFQNIHSNYLKITDLSVVQKQGELESQGQSVFVDTVCFNPEEKRSYLFWLQPIDTYYKLDNTQSHNLGQLQL